MTFAADISLFVIFHCVIGISWFHLLRRLKEPRSSSTLLKATILTFAQIILSGLVLGIFQCLYQQAFLICVAIVTIVVLISCRFLPDPHKEKIDTKGILGVTSSLVIILFVFLLSLAIGRAYLFFEISADGPWYHLPIVALLNQHHGFFDSSMPFIDAYPKFIHIWFLWLYYFFGTTRWIDGGQIPFLLAGALGLYVFCRNLGVSRSSSLLGALFSCFAPVIFSQIVTSHIDVALSALLVISLALGMSAISQQKKSDFICCGIALGLFLGTKFSSLFIVLALLFLFVLVQRARSPHVIPNRREGSLSNQLGWILIPTILIGAQPYLSNIIKYQNPIYPYKVSLGFIELPGLLGTNDFWELRELGGASNFSATIKSWVNVSETGYGYFLGGFGITWPAMIVLLSILVLTRRKDKRILTLLPFALAFLLTPLKFSTRFTLFLLQAGGLGSALLMDSLDSRLKLKDALKLLILLCCIATGIQTLSSYKFQLKQAHFTFREACINVEAPPGYKDAFSWIQKNMPVGSKIFFVSSWEPAPLVCAFRNFDSDTVEFVHLSGGNLKEVEEKLNSVRNAFVFFPKEKGLSVAGKVVVENEFVGILSTTSTSRSTRSEG